MKITKRKENSIGKVSPSLICGDLTALGDQAERIASAGCDMLHVDILDGYFAPSQPIGVDMVKQLRKKSDLFFDVHIMAVENRFFVDEMIAAGADRICFHVETEKQITQMLSHIRSSGIQAGVAFMPATSPSVMEYAIELCDFVLFMRINPGYAGNKSEKAYSFVTDKILWMSDLIADRGLDTSIIVDGRTGFNDLAELTAAGMDTTVGGSVSFFDKGNTPSENYKRILEEMEKGMILRRGAGEKNG